MNARLTSLPEFTIRQLETSAEIEAFVRLNAETFRPDEDVETVTSRRYKFLVADPAFHPGQSRGAFINNTYIGGYIIRERQLCLEAARLSTGCIGGVVTHPDYRHQGIATALMQEALTYAYNQHYALLLLHGIQDFYHQFGYIDCLEDIPEHAIDRKLLPEEPSDAYTVRLATLSDVPILLAFYQHYYGEYLGSFAPTRTLARQKHLYNWFQENMPLLALDADNKPQGYLLLTRRWNRLYGYEVAANTWPAILALLQYHSHLLESETEPSEELWWTIPPHSLTYYLLTDHLPVRSEAYAYPNQGWMARHVHLPTLFQSLLPLWQMRWKQANSPWSGNIALNIDNHTCSLKLEPASLRFNEHASTHTVQVSLTPQVFTQLLFGFRPISWATLQPGQVIPTEIAPVLNLLFPTKQAWIAGSDYF